MENVACKQASVPASPCSEIKLVALCKAKHVGAVWKEAPCGRKEGLKNKRLSEGLPHGVLNLFKVEHEFCADSVGTGAGVKNLCGSAF